MDAHGLESSIPSGRQPFLASKFTRTRCWQLLSRPVKWDTDRDRQGIKVIYKRLFRIYAHVFHSHFKAERAQASLQRELSGIKKTAGNGGERRGRTFARSPARSQSLRVRSGRYLANMHARNHSFKHFVYFVKEFDLIEESEWLGCVRSEGFKMLAGG